MKILNLAYLKSLIFNILDSNMLPSAISNIFNGISKRFVSSSIEELSIEILNNASLEKLYNYINKIISDIGTKNLSFEKIYNDNGVAKDYYLVETSDKQNSFSLNFFIDNFYYNKETSETFTNYRNTLLKLILETLKKYNKRLYNINEKLKECDGMDKYRVYGELITANLYKIPNVNVEELELENYYDNNSLIKIKLDKKYSPSVNAKRFFKKYSKLKNALVVVSDTKN